MSKESYTNKKIEIENILNSVGDGKISTEKINEIIDLVGDTKDETNQPQKEEAIESIKLRLLEESDWRKKVVLAAMIISKSLEDY
jgi:hypothetical protein